jgi:hypothetical protein
MIKLRVERGRGAAGLSGWCDVVDGWEGGILSSGLLSPKAGCDCMAGPNFALLCRR